MATERSPRILFAVILLLAALFLIMNQLARGLPIGDWILSIVVLLGGIALLVWEWMETHREAEVTSTELMVPEISGGEMTAPPEIPIDPATSIAMAHNAPAEPTVHTPPTAGEAPVQVAPEPVTEVVPEPPLEEPTIPVTEPKPFVNDPEPPAAQQVLEDSSPLEKAARDGHPVAEKKVADAMAAPPEEPRVGDNLEVIEGIGVKMAAAMVAAGFDSFQKLARTSEDEIRAAIKAAGMRFAPSVPTWPQQADYAAKGDWDGLRAYQATLTGGRKSS